MQKSIQAESGGCVCLMQVSVNLDSLSSVDRKYEKLKSPSRSPEIRQRDSRSRSVDSATSGSRSRSPSRSRSRSRSKSLPKAYSVGDDRFVTAPCNHTHLQNGFSSSCFDSLFWTCAYKSVQWPMARPVARISQPGDKNHEGGHILK